MNKLTLLLLWLFCYLPFPIHAQENVDSKEDSTYILKDAPKVPTKWILGKWVQKDTQNQKANFDTIEFKEDSLSVSIFPQAHVHPYTFHKVKDSIHAEGLAINWPPYYCKLIYIDEHTLEIDYWSFGAGEVLTRKYLKKTPSYEEELGIAVLLPKYKSINFKETKRRNLLYIQISSNNDSILIDSILHPISNLRNIVLNKLIHDNSDTTKPEVVAKDLPLIEEFNQTKLQIVFRTKRVVYYETYKKVLKTIILSYQIARNEAAAFFFKLKYDALDKEQKSAINELIPIRIHEELIDN